MHSFEQLWAGTFRYAAEHSPFYRELFRGFSDIPALTQLPTVDKRIVSEHNLDFLCVPRERIVEIVTTSGTTGQPLLWMLTDSDHCPTDCLYRPAPEVQLHRESKGMRHPGISLRGGSPPTQH